MRVGSLFSGYGGLDMAVERYFGATTAWFVEFDKHPSTVLAQRWPGVPNYGDITAVDWAAVEPVDILTGGFPCQDVSTAGLRRGVRPGTRSGLWEHFAYAINALRPGLVVIENVSGLLSADAHCDVEPCPWCVGDEPAGHMRALGAVLADLAEAGFDAEWCSVRAADAGAPHGRLRVFIVATDASRGQLAGAAVGADRLLVAGERGSEPDGLTLLPTPAARDHRDSIVEQSSGSHRPGDVDSVPRAVRDMHADFGPYAAAIHRWEQVLGRPAPSPTEPGKDGRPRLSPAFVEFMMGLPDGWVCDTGIPRNAQLKALGNGVVPAQAALALSMLLPRLYGGEAAKDAEEVA